MQQTDHFPNKKRAFLMASLELFAEKGYDKATIQDIIDKVGVSKGAFYHYFSSKEDIIETIAREYVDGAVSLMEKIVARQDLNAVEKMNEMFKSVNEYKGRQEEQRNTIKGIFSSEKNIKLEKKIENAYRDDAVRHFKAIIDQGMEEGSFQHTDSSELAEFLLSVINGMNASIDALVNKRDNPENGLDDESFMKRLTQKLTFYQEMFTRVLQIKKGTIRLKESYIKRFIK